MSNFKFDTHMHLDLYKNRESIIEYIEKERSYTIAMTNLPMLYEKYVKEYGDFKYIKFALGFHPELVLEYMNQFPIFLKNLNNTRYIGEIGLDYSTKDDNNRMVQYKVFKNIIDECNRIGGKILSIHSRKAVKDINSLIENFNGKVILHWFSGTQSELNMSISNGCFFSINQQMINSDKGIKLIRKIPLNQILMESDAPFTEGLKEKYETNFMDIIISSLSVVCKVKKDTIEEQLKQNFLDVIGG